MRSVCSQPCSHDGAAYASDGGFHAQACYHCSQAAEKALRALLLALDQEPERTHSIERLLGALELLGIETAPLRPLPLKALQRMTTASRNPDGDEAPVDLFDGRDGALALEVARAVVEFADQQLGELDGPPGSRTA
jgi:HEPN domain-containing protein